MMTIAEVERAVSGVWSLWPVGFGHRELDLAPVIEGIEKTSREFALQGPAVVEPLLALVRSGGFGMPAPAAARFLADLPFAEAAQALVDASSEFGNPVAFHAAINLVHLPISEDNYRIVARAFGEFLAGDQKVGAGIQIARALLRQSVGASDGLSELWARIRDADLRRDFVSAVAALGGDEGRSLLAQCSRDDDSIVRARALFGLILGGNADARTELYGMMAAKNSAARIEAIDLCGRLAFPDTVGALAPAISSKSPKERVAALAALLRLGKTESLPAVWNMLADSSSLVREQARGVLEALTGTYLDLKFDGAGMPTPESLDGVYAGIMRIAGTWSVGLRYRAGKLLRVGQLIDALVPGSEPPEFYTLVCMTGLRHGYIPFCDTYCNWSALGCWRAWEREHAEEFDPGHWYYFGQGIVAGNE